MKILAPFVAFNIIFLPILIYLHLQGECALLNYYLGSDGDRVCIYVNNIWLNILYINIIIFVIGLFLAGGAGGGHGGGGGGKSSGGSHSKPSGGGGH